MVIVTSYFQVSNLPILFRPGTSVCTQQHGLLPHHLIIHLFCWVFGSRYANFAGYVIYLFLLLSPFCWICMVFLGLAMRWMVLKGQPTWLRHFASAWWPQGAPSDWGFIHIQHHPDTRLLTLPSNCFEWWTTMVLIGFFFFFRGV